MEYREIIKLNGKYKLNHTKMLKEKLFSHDISSEIFWRQSSQKRHDLYSFALNDVHKRQLFSFHLRICAIASGILTTIKFKKYIYI